MLSIRDLQKSRPLGCCACLEEPRLKSNTLAAFVLQIFFLDVIGTVAVDTDRASRHDFYPEFCSLQCSGSQGLLLVLIACQLSLLTVSVRIQHSVLLERLTFVDFDSALQCCYSV